ncbi:MAG: hypothetical protein ABW172_01040 [Candidatus Binatia bacterium]
MGPSSMEEVPPESVDRTLVLAIALAIMVIGLVLFAVLLLPVDARADWVAQILNG